MGFFDLFKSEETLKTEKEERKKREWDNLSDREKCNRMEKEQEELYKRGKERMRLSAEYSKNVSIWKKHATDLLIKHPGEFYTVIRVLDLLSPQSREERKYYEDLFHLHPHFSGGKQVHEDLRAEGIWHMENNDTIFYYFPKR